MSGFPRTTPIDHTSEDVLAPLKPSLAYPHGVVKKTWAFGQTRNNDIKLEEVLEPNSVRIAALSAFQWNPEWVLSKLKTPANGGTTKCIFVMQAKSDEERSRYREWANGSGSWMRVCLPPMGGLIWCMHSKLMLLFHKDKLRIAIPTANLLNFDWGETGQMENTVFLIDLPRLTHGASQTTKDLTFFGRELTFYLEKQGFPEDARQGILGFDFEATKHMAFVHTIGGVHYERHGSERTGLLGLSRAVRHLGLAADNDLEIDFAASSIGKLDNAQLQDLYAACCGRDFVADAVKSRSKAANNFFQKANRAKASTGVHDANVKEKLCIYFPTKETVQASIAGDAGTICLQRKHFEGGKFPRAVFRDYISKRQGLLSHNKILLVRSTERQHAWVYVGSANMSKSAWGELPANRTEKKITCRNWECGVLLPVANDKFPGKRSVDEDDNETESESEDPVSAEPAKTNVGTDVFRGLIDIPFEIPGPCYNGREPWYFTEEH